MYPPGNDDARKEAKRKAYIQGYAMGELTEMEQQEWIPPEMELAEMIDVPVLHAGVFPSHNAGPVEVTEEELDEIVEGSNKLQPVIQEAIHTGTYRGNEEVSQRLTKPIPGLLNLKHQQIFPETLKTAVQGVTTTFQKAIVDGKTWIIQRLSNIPTDIADTIQREFPFRSVEMLPLTDPESGKFYPKIIRSTAFLDKFTPPAVPGQSPELLVEFAAQNEPLTIITTQGVNIMADKQEKSVDVSELQKKQETLTAQIAELQAKGEERDKALELAAQQMEEKDAKIAELQGGQDKLNAEKCLTHLSRVREENSRVLRVSPAFLDIVRSGVENNGVIELQEGQTSQRDAFVTMCDEIVELASKGNILIDITPATSGNHVPPNTKKTDSEKVAELMEKEGITKNEAFIRVLNDNLVKEEG
jgi:hypothetical protein